MFPAIYYSTGDREVPTNAGEGDGRMSDNNFYTLKGYDRQRDSGISPTMEDYLEMICRQLRTTDYVRNHDLAAKLNVTPPSCSKMMAKLREQGLLDFEPYGIIRLTPKGRSVGAYLLHRHEVLDQFFRLVNQSSSELELVEKIEHFIDARTVSNIEALINRLTST